MRAARVNLWFARGWLGAGFVFLYLPIVALVVFSFNDSPVPTQWRGFTLKWYQQLLGDDEIIAGLWLSLKIALLTACGSVVLGTLAGFSLVKYRRVRGPPRCSRGGGQRSSPRGCWSARSSAVS